MSIYELKQSMRQWNKKIDTFKNKNKNKKNDLIFSKADSYVYYNFRDHLHILIDIYINNNLI